ncbi:hypothetical protein ACFY41_24595 [Streptomyces syringium]|uniref:hypothetical protein n=1 Tax=Streptomyces syringium TaxID=76729 RepID=UPI0036AA81A5
MSPSTGVTAVMPTGVLNSLVAAVKEDPAGLPAAVRQRVQRSQDAENVTMMGGWTSEQPPATH